MGELKELREERANLVNRAKSLANTLYLAGLGAYSKPMRNPRSSTDTICPPVLKPTATRPTANQNWLWPAVACS